MSNTLSIRMAAGAALCVGALAHAQELYDNGPMLTSPNTCTIPPPGMISETQLTNTTTGFNANADTGNRLADDFLISDVNGWDVTGFKFYAYETGQGPTGNQFSGVNLRVWRGRPGDPGSVVVFGDTTTNRMTGFAFANLYRVGKTGVQCSTDRAVCEVTCVIPMLFLAPGSYWVDWQVSSPSSLSGPWVPPVCISGLAGKPGADAVGYLPSTLQWVLTTDGGSTAAQDLAFKVMGTIVGGTFTCYANCDHSTGTPILNVNDFSCFLNKFSSGDSYANCDGSTIPPILTINDFQCFLNSFAGGCSAP